MGAAGSVPLSAEAALAAGHSQADVDAYQAINKLFEECERDAENKVTRKSFLQTLAKHDQDAELKKGLGLAEDGTIPAFMNAFHAEVGNLEGKYDGLASASEVVTFLTKYKTPAADQVPQSSTPEPVSPEPAAVPALNVAAATDEPFVMEFSSVEMSQTSRPVTSRKVPARFRNRPATSRRPPTSKAAKPAPIRKPSRPKTSKTIKKVDNNAEEIKPGTDSYKAIEQLIGEAEADAEGNKKRGSFLAVLDQHVEDDELRAKLGLPAQKDGDTKAVSAFRGAFDEYVTAFTDKKHDGTISAEEVANFLTKYRNTALRVLGVC